MKKKLGKELEEGAERSSWKYSTVAPDGATLEEGFRRRSWKKELETGAG